MSKLLRGQGCFGQVLSLENFKQSVDLNSLISHVRGQSIELLVILEKKQERSFVILDTRNMQLLGEGSGRDDGGWSARGY